MGVINQQYLEPGDKFKYKLSKKGHILLESMGILKELKLSVENAVDIQGNPTKGSFYVSDKIYEFHAENMSPSLEIGGQQLNGSIFNIGFNEAGDDLTNIDSFIGKGGKTDLIKVYSTMYKVFINLINSIHPDYLIIYAYDKSGYWPIYNQLIKDNPLSGYNRKTIIEFIHDSESCKGVILKKNNKNL